MLRKITLLLLAGALLAVPATAGEELTLDQVLANNFEARGGLNKLRAIDTIKMIGTMSMPMGGGMEVPFTVEMKRPKKARIEFTVQGMTGVQAYDGTTGWSIMPFMGKTDPEEMSADQLEEMEDQADIDGVLVDFAKKGHQVELLGKEDIEGTEAYKLKVTKKNGNVDYYYLDAEYFLEIKVEGKREQQGVETEIEVTFGDYKEVEGIMMAHSIEQKPKGAPAGQTLTFNQIEVNGEIADDRFAMPAAEATE